jgi:omega-6 fatty acid desaturase (delta-12 desaturase)
MVNVWRKILSPSESPVHIFGNMSSTAAATRVTPPLASLQAIVAPYERGATGAAWFAFATSVPAFALTWWLMLRSLSMPYWITIALAFPCAGFVMRTFIVQHDCGHGSFIMSSRLRVAIGRLCSLVTLVPYGYFRRFHGAHHATSGKLDGRGIDIETLTVREYLALSRIGRIRYRVARNLLVLFGIAPLLYFAVAMRIPMLAKKHWVRERNSILLTDVALAVVIGLVVRSIGWVAFLQIQLPVTAIASTVGMWMFYIQHQFEDTYWAREGEWDYGRAALEGSSYYALPPVFEWFTGYIGLHHVHHLSPLVPSYRLALCVRENEVLSNVPRIGLIDGIRCARLKLWDEDRRKLVGWRELGRGTRVPRI